jgi:hypothetical protein
MRRVSDSPLLIAQEVLFIKRNLVFRFVCSISVELFLTQTLIRKMLSKFISKYLKIMEFALKILWYIWEFFSLQ